MSSIFLFAAILVLACLWLNGRKAIQILKLEKSLERNKAVYWFRMYWSKKDPDFYKSLPPYKEMLEGSMPITEEYFRKSIEL